MPGNAILRDSIDTVLNQQLAHIMRPAVAPAIVTTGDHSSKAVPRSAPVSIGGGGGGGTWGIARLAALFVGMLLIIISAYKIFHD